MNRLKNFRMQFGIKSYMMAYIFISVDAYDGGKGVQWRESTGSEGVFGCKTG